MNSELAQRARHIVDSVAVLLDDQHVARLIDEPIDQAVASLDHPESAGSQEEFLRIAGAFLQHITGKVASRQLHTWQARAEVIALLEEAYRGTNGYGGALLDAVDPASAGVSVVLAGLTEHLKARYRSAYVRWVLSRAIDPADWDLKAAVAEVILGRWGPDLPAELKSCTSEQLADLWPDLLLMDQETAKILHRPFYRATA